MAAVALTHIIAPAPSTTRGSPLRFSLAPKGNLIAYANGNAVYLRPFDTSSASTGKVIVCTRHSKPVTCVALSPNGAYCASGDQDGDVIVWSTTNADLTEALRTRPISGIIRDIAWSDDGQRLLVVGEGKGSFGAVFLVDGGAGVGTITGHTKHIMAGDFRKQRPYRLATGGFDGNVALFEGPPFKFTKSLSDFGGGSVNAVRFSPDGSLCAVGGADKAITLLDGKTGERVGHIATGHGGSIYSLAWGDNGQTLFSASADKTVKVFRAADGGPCIATTTFEDPSSIDYMQLGVAVAGDVIVSVSLNGDVNRLRPEGGAPADIFVGHQKSITGISFDRGSATLLSSSSDGKVVSWQFEDSHSPYGTTLKGLAPLLKNVSALVRTSIGSTFLVGNDDAVVRLDDVQHPPTPLPKVSGGANSVAALPSGTGVVVATSNALFLIEGSTVSPATKAPYGPASVVTATITATSSDQVWVGGKDNAIHIYQLAGSTLTESKVLSGRHKGNVTSLARNADSSLVAAGDGNREIVLWNTETHIPHPDFDGVMVFHTSRVNTLTFSPNARYLISGSVDASIIVWNLTSKSSRLIAAGAHLGGVNVTHFLSDYEFVSGGSDASIRLWKIPDGW